MKNTGVGHMPSVEGHVLNVTLNLAYVSLLYGIMAAIVATIVRAISFRYDDTWRKMTTTLQCIDIATEVSIIVVLAFWTTYWIHFMVPVLPVDRRLEHFIEVYGGRLVFAYTLFLFVHDLGSKMKYTFSRITGDHDVHP